MIRREPLLNNPIEAILTFILLIILLCGVYLLQGAECIACWIDKKVRG